MCRARVLWLALPFVLWVTAIVASGARAAELVMFEESGCPWCRRWHAEVGVGYPKSEEGRRAPLRTVDLHGSRPADLAFINGLRASPTFVLIDDGREIGRIIGYPGADFFWGLLAQMLERVPVKGAGDGATRCPQSAGDVQAGRHSC